MVVWFALQIVSLPVCLQQCYSVASQLLFRGGIFFHLDRGSCRRRIASRFARRQRHLDVCYGCLASSSQNHSDHHFLLTRPCLRKATVVQPPSYLVVWGSEILTYLERETPIRLVLSDYHHDVKNIHCEVIKWFLKDTARECLKLWASLHSICEKVDDQHAHTHQATNMEK